MNERCVSIDVKFRASVANMLRGVSIAILVVSFIRKKTEAEKSDRK